jgi:hypothetical protein
VVRHRRLDEVPGAVELVPIAQVAPALALALDREVAVEVAVLALRGLQHADRGVDHRLDPRPLGVARAGQRPARRLQPLVDVGVVELAADIGAVPRAGDAAEVVEAAGLLQVLELPGDRLLAVGANARRPDRIVERDGVDRHRPVGGVGAATGVDGSYDRGGADGVGHGECSGGEAASRCQHATGNPAA